MKTEVERAIYSTNQAIQYVGSKQFFQQLLDAYPTLLTPIRICKPTGTKRDGKPTKGKTEYLKATIDTVLKAAQMEQRFVEKS